MSLTQWENTFTQVLIHDVTGYARTEIITPQVLATAHISTLYWTVRLIVYAMVGKVLLDEEGEDLDGKYIEAGTFCRKILEVLPVFLNPAAGIFRLHLMLFPMGTVRLYLVGMPADSMMEERRLLETYLSHPACYSTQKMLGSLRLENYVRNFSCGRSKLRNQLLYDTMHNYTQ